ncbi:MAG: T9SS type A sorting domain-containing protein [Bacteroidia bacterium]
MKKILFALGLIIPGAYANAQNGLENIIVEKYYVSNAADAAGSIGTLPVGSVTYRIYADMLPNYKFQAAYGVPGHEFRIATTTSFFNNEDRGATTPNAIGNNRLPDNTVMLDSWLSVGAASAANFGIPKSEDNGVSNIVNADGILQNNDPAAGIPLTTQDGVIAGTPQAVTFVGLTTELDVFDATSQLGNLFSTSNGSVASLNGSFGPTSTNRVLIAQITTDGTLSFELNIQIGTPTGGVQNFVAKNPAGSEIVLPSLTYPAVAAVAIAANPVGAICSGTNVTFTATPVNGGPSPTYQWKKNGINVGTNSATYSNTSLTNGNQITCVMTSNLGGVAGSPATSNAIIMQVNALPTATITPAGPTTFCSGTNPLTLNANAGAGFTYQWKKGTTNISGATNITYAPTTSATYKVQVTNAGGCTKLSSGIVVTVNALPAATITHTGPTTFCSGTTPLTLTANSGTGFTYQWKKGTTNISGATNISYVPTTSSTYKVQVTNASGCTKLSSGVVVTVNALPTASITSAGPTTFCSGTTPLTLTANSGTGFTYQWRKGTTDIAGATNISYMPTSSGTYKVVVINANGCTKVSTAGVAVTANPLPAATVTAQGPLTFCAGDSVVLQANAGAGLSYQWKKGTAILSGATLQNYTAKTAGTYKVVVTNANTCSKTSASKTVTINCKTGNEIAHQPEMQISIYPNPSDGPFTLNLSNEGIEDGIADIELINMLGQNVYSNTAEFSNGELSKQIYLGNNSVKGLYLVRINLNGVVYNSRLILQ